MSVFYKEPYPMGGTDGDPERLSYSDIVKELKKKRPSKLSKPNSKVVAAMGQKLCAFADEHKLVIHPGGYRYYIESYNMFNCCPCDKARKCCPCPESPEEVARLGHCKCRLFWRSYQDFAEIMLTGGG